jgi:tetratricopeptide (TPR) repeat protein
MREELCYVFEAKSQYDDAIQVCNQLIDKEPYSYDYWFTLGRLYSLVNAFEEAIEAFDFALTCDDSDDQLKILKAYCLFMNENYEKAIEVYSDVSSEEEATDDKIKSLMAECYIKLEDFEQAYNLLKGIVYKSTSDSYVYISYIRCCVETDRGRDASQALIKAVDLFPKNVRILSLLALSYIESGREDLALAVTGKIINQLSEADTEDDDDDEPEGEYDEFFKKVLQINPHLPSQKTVPTEDLIKEYLSNKKNNN